jgi:hypothetical protein
LWYPQAVKFACDAVEAIARERESKALLNWLNTAILEDPEVISDNTMDMPELSRPFSSKLKMGNIDTLLHPSDKEPATICK